MKQCRSTLQIHLDSHSRASKAQFEIKRNTLSLGVPVYAATFVLLLTACGGSSSVTPNPSSAAGSASATASAILAEDLGPHSEATYSALQIVGSDPGVSPFIQRLTISGNSLWISTVEFTIQPKPGSASKAVDVTYSLEALLARGYLKGDLTLPIFGLYEGYTNVVSLHFTFQDGSTLAMTTNINTADYVDPTGIYQHPTILKQRVAGSALGFNFFYVKSELGSPVIIDSDGEVRWVVPGVLDAMSTALQGDEFVVGDAQAATVHSVRLDGTLSASRLASPSVLNFHHNIDYGNVGLLAEVTTQSNGVENFESTVMEITDQGSVLNQWDLGPIISAYMTSMGDDPTAFVRPPIDWFHNNAAAYDPSDDSVIISSRENFVVKLDYHTGQIIWILGDPTKYWYTFPSLRAKALTLAPGGLYPIGQHAVSITAEGNLLLFNDGLGSVNQPAGQPAGETRTFSAVSAYSIDAKTMTAQNIWNFENAQTVFSSVCSSAYKAPEESLLINYATADNDKQALLVGLDSNHAIAFEFEYPTVSCDTSWNAVPIPLEDFTVN